MSSRETSTKLLANILERVGRFERDAHVILGTHEDSKSRIISLTSTYKTLSALSINQDELFRQALRCIESELFRAAHVMAWAGFMDFLDEKLASDGFVRLRQERQNWKFTTVEDLREISTEFGRVEAVKLVGLCNKTEMKAYHGLLNKRNESAHPSSYYPGLNEALGYISELLSRIRDLESRSI